MPYVVESHRRLVVHSPMHPGLRVFLALVAIFPLLAPYELIIEPNWESYLNPVFFFVSAISIGALSVSAFFAWAAVAGVSSTLAFDKADKTFCQVAEAPVMRRRRDCFPLRAVRSVEVETHELESSTVYSLVVVLEDGSRYTSASSVARSEAEDIRDRVARFLTT